MKPLTVLFLFLPASTLHSQGHVWVVDDGGGPGIDFTGVQEAIDAAQDGDVLLVKEGQYGDLHLLNRSLTISAEAGANVGVGTIGVASTASEKSVRLQGLRSVQTTEYIPCTVNDNDGVVWIEDCTFEPKDFNQLESPGLYIHGSNAVTLVDVSATGQFVPGPCYTFTYSPGDPGAGARIQDSTVIAFNCAFRGGDGNSYGGCGICTVCVITFSGAPALEIEGASSIQMSATSASGGKGGPSTMSYFGTCLSAAGGPGLYVPPAASDPTIVLQDCSVQGGPGGGPDFLAGCPGGPEGPDFIVPPSVGLEQVAVPAIKMSAGSPLREGATLDLALDGPPQALVLLGVSDTAVAIVAPFLGGPLAILPSPLIVALGTTSASGTLSVALPLYSLPPAWESATYFGQCAYLDPAGQGSLGTAQLLVLLDDSF